MAFNQFLRGTKFQFRRFRVPLLIFVLFWSAGILFLYFVESDKSPTHLILVSMSVRSSDSGLALVDFYQLLWPLFFELLVIGLLLSVILEYYSYNPEVRARKLAKHKKNHTVVLGYNHLGERIVDFLRERKKPYTLIEIDQSKVDDLITLEQPVIVGDYSDLEIMKAASVHKCKEVFCITNELRRALIAAENIRKLNEDCCIYMRVFNEHFREYLSNEPWKAFTFSVSNWAMESVKEWSKEIEGKIMVLGNDTVVQRITRHLGEKMEKELYVIDPNLDLELFLDIPNIHIIMEEYRFLTNLEELCNLEEVSQIYICWNEEKLFSDAIILTMAMLQKYPHIKVFVRMFDEELAKIATHMGATTFSTSAHAFKMLKKQVRFDSNLF